MVLQTSGPAAAKLSRTAYFKVRLSASQEVTWSEDVNVTSCDGGISNIRGSGRSTLQIHTGRPQLAIAKRVGGYKEATLKFRFGRVGCRWRERSHAAGSCMLAWKTRTFKAEKRSCGRQSPCAGMIVVNSRGSIYGLSFALALCLALLLVAQPGLAAKPLRGGRYVGAAGQIVAAVQVSRAGDALTPGRGGSYVKVNSLAFDPVCLKRPAVALVGRGRRVPVDRRGRFSIMRRFDANSLRAHGRFLTPYTARLVFRVRPASGFRCEPGPRVVMLHPRGVDPPFSGCRSQRATTLLESEDARIFNQRKVFYGYYFRPVAYGCLFSVDKRFELGLDDPEAPTGDADSSDARDFQLAGPYTAYLLSYVGALTGGDVVNVVDLRGGTRVLPTRFGLAPPDVSMSRLVRGLVLKDNGSVAWVQNSSYSHEEQLWAYDTLGYRKLDNAPQRADPLPITSLQLTGSTLTWLHDGEPRSATLY